MTKERVIELFNKLKPERKRKKIPKPIIDLAIKEVNKIKKIPFKHKDYDNIFWGDNPIKETPLTINLPHIEVDELIDVPEDFIKSAVFYDTKKVKSQKIKIIKDSCVVTHKGEIMIVYITSKTDKAILKATERVNDLAKGLDKYYPVKKDSFYTPFLLTKAGATKAEKQATSKFKKEQASVPRYTGKNWMDGMIKYFIGVKDSKGGTMVSYQPRNPDADDDKQFLYDLIYTYMSLYELEKRYTPDVADYRLKLAKEAGFPSAFPGVPLDYHCSTGVGGSFDFSSAIHNDSGIKGLTETIIWNKPRNNENQYFVSPTIKMCFDLTDNKAIIFQPPKIPHSTLQSGEHNGIGLVNITKQNLVAKTEINKQYYDLWKKSFEGKGLIKKSNIPVSQIFLTLTKDKIINDFPIYMDSMEKFKKITTKYTLFDDTKAEPLMKKYKEFYSMWKNVKYDIMKVDILRFVILYHYGGFVCDLDVFPLTHNLENVLEDKTKLIIFTPKYNFNYEVIYTPAKNEIMLEFLRYVKTQIEEKDKMKIYETRKARYVIQTTGQNSFKRFLDTYHKKDNNIIYTEMGTILRQNDFERLKENIKTLPFVSLQMTEWLGSIGRKETNKEKVKAREEILKILN